MNDGNVKQVKVLANSRRFYRLGGNFGSFVLFLTHIDKIVSEKDNCFINEKDAYVLKKMEKTHDKSNFMGY